MVMVLVFFLTALITYIQSIFWYRYILRDLLIIGTIDAIVVSLLVTPLVIKLILIEQKRVKDELRALALTDDLTKLNNRRGFFLLAEQILKIASRTRAGIYLMYSDLDNLKKINDTFGHEEGDRALQAYANLLKANYRESDVIARIGGDEFVLVPVGSSKDDISVILDRFDKILIGYNQSHDNPWILSATVGLAYFDPEAPSTLDELLSQADKALYEGKRNNEKRSVAPKQIGSIE
jgi:diguanylate cyclase (GGDEF)-like protein